MCICQWTYEVCQTRKILFFNLSPKPKRKGLAKIIHFFFPRILTLCEKTKRTYTAKKYYSKKRNIVKEVTKKAIEKGISEDEINLWKKRLPEELVNAANRYEFNGAILSNGLLNPDYWIKSLEVSTSESNQRWTNMKSVLDVGYDLCVSNSIDFIVVYIPSPIQYNPRHHSPENVLVLAGVQIKNEWLTNQSQFQEKLNRWCKQKSIPCIDLTEPFRKAPNKDRLNYKLDSH